MDIFSSYLWTWLFWGIAILQDASMETDSGISLLLFGVTVLMVTGILFTYLTRCREGRKDYWKRVINFKEIPARWYLVIFLFAPCLHIISALFDNASGGGSSTWGKAVLQMVNNPVSIFASIMFATLIPLIEELG